MRIIFLNSWFALAGEPLFDFIKTQSTKTDIFAFVEVDPDLFFKLEKMLPDFNGVYEKGMYEKITNHYYGQSVFVKKNIYIGSLGQIHPFRNVWNDVTYATACRLEIQKQTLYLLLVHGKVRPWSKLDTSTRIRQSKKFIELFKDKKAPKIIGGDFNLMPFTKSIKMFEDAGYKNLIKEFNVQETRNKLSWDQFPNEEKQHFADYCFVSPEVKVINFEVPNIEISDHLPLILDFSLDSARD